MPGPSVAARGGDRPSDARVAPPRTGVGPQLRHTVAHNGPYLALAEEVAGELWTTDLRFGRLPAAPERTGCAHRDLKAQSNCSLLGIGALPMRGRRVPTAVLGVQAWAPFPVWLGLLSPKGMVSTKAG
jgi:hypothetical protein